MHGMYTMVSVRNVWRRYHLTHELLSLFDTFSWMSWLYSVWMFFWTQLNLFAMWMLQSIQFNWNCLSAVQMFYISIYCRHSNTKWNFGFVLIAMWKYAPYTRLLFGPKCTHTVAHSLQVQFSAWFCFVYPCIALSLKLY